jgi:hypothetical protein
LVPPLALASDFAEAPPLLALALEVAEAPPRASVVLPPPTASSDACSVGEQAITVEVTKHPRVAQLDVRIVFHSSDTLTTRRTPACGLCGALPSEGAALSGGGGSGCANNEPFTAIGSRVSVQFLLQSLDGNYSV